MFEADSECYHVVRDIYTNEGPKALFKGLGPTLVGVVPARSVSDMNVNKRRANANQSLVYAPPQSYQLLHLRTDEVRLGLHLPFPRTRSHRVGTDGE